MILLDISLLALLWMIYYANNRDYLRPSFLFCLSFIFSALWATVYMSTWDLNLHLNTYLVLTGGIILFTLCDKITGVIYRGTHKRYTMELHTIEIENWKLCFLIILEVVAVIGTIRGLQSMGERTLFEAIFGYRQMTASAATSEQYQLPISRQVGWCRSLARGAGFWFAYILANNLVCSKKKLTLNNFLLIVLIVLSIICCCLFGGRQYFVNVILACVFCYIFLQRKTRGGKARSNIKFKDVFLLSTVSVAVLWAFKNFSNLIGKDLSAISLMDYLAKYCGAEIKNLDLHLQKSEITGSTGIWGFQTFRMLLLWLGRDLPAADLPFRQVNGFDLGNACTTYYDFIYDFGYSGMIILVAIMAIILAIIYERMNNARTSLSGALIGTLFGYQIPNILLSFFSNEFYQYTVGKSFFTTVIMWVLLYIFCCKVRINAKAKKVIVIHKAATLVYDKHIIIDEKRGPLCSK